MKPVPHQGHHWRLKTPGGIRILGVAIAVVNVAFLVLAMAAADGDWMILIPIAAILAGGLLGMLLARSYIYIRFDTTDIQIGLWPFSQRTIRFAELKTYALIPQVRPSAFGGIGVRKTSGQQTGYLWEAGPGLELQTIDGETVTVVFDEAEDARLTLESLLEDSKHRQKRA